MKEYDAIIIGTGQSGPSLAGRLVEPGMKVAIVERKFFGGTCVNTGCMPTKTLVASAYAAHMARRAADFGVTIDGAINVDMKAVKVRKDAVSARSRVGLEKWLKNLRGCTAYEGHARFVSARLVLMGNELLKGRHIFVNVGGRALVPSIPGLDQVDYLTLKREGIDVHVNAKCLGVAKRGKDIAVSVDCTDGAAQVVGSHLLLAVGRRPNTDDLGLDKAGVAVDAKGFIQVDDQLLTNVPGIWAMGDCNGRGAFTHTSYNDFEIIAANLLENDPRRVTDRIPAYALYTDPPLGRAGMTEWEVRKSGKAALIATIPMTNVGRAFEKGETEGFMKILVDKNTKQILGASFLGLSGDEVIHCILDLMYAKAPYTVMQRAMHIHPTVSELIPTMMTKLKPLQRLEQLSEVGSAKIAAAV